MSITILVQLAAVETFKNVPKEQLEWLKEKGEIEKFESGNKIFEKNEPFHTMTIVLDGRISISLEQKGQYREIERVEAGEITGLLPYSRATKHIGTGIAAKPTVILSLHRKYFSEMIRQHHAMVEALVHLMISRVREFSRMRHHDEKLMSLGKLAAGLAHELNNPGSAMVRSARELKKNLHTAPLKLRNMVSAPLSLQQIDAVNKLLMQKVDQDYSQLKLSLMEKTQRIEDLAEWLETHNIEDGYEFAESFYQAHFTPDELNALVDIVPDAHLLSVIEWMDCTLITEHLVQEIEDSAAKIVGLVHSIKSYSHLDLTPDKQPTDIRQGLESTLTMLTHKLKKKNIQVIFDLQDLPEIHAFIGELNQAWTNIIDNAIDAMDKDGTLKIKTERDGESIVVSFVDNGHGIPEENLSQIFDPFFTTKSVGQGTGLGLDIVYKIIQHHNGAIKVFSKPGKTEFQISIPIDEGS